jgi:hypothetical protein
MAQTKNFGRRTGGEVQDPLSHGLGTTEGPRRGEAASASRLARRARRRARVYGLVTISKKAAKSGREKRVNPDRSSSCQAAGGMRR